MSATLALLDLDPPADELALLDASLSAAERTRARRYRLPRDAARFVARRGLVRRLLGHYLGCAPDRLIFDHSPFGRPFVAGGPEFSIAHSGAVGLCAISARGPIGCDIERRNPMLADPAVAERLFAPGERRALAALPPDRWARGFFDCWTRKEAVVKALGVGLSCPLDAFEVPLTPADGMMLPISLSGLCLQAFEILPDYSIATCVAAGEQVAPPLWSGLDAPKIAPIDHCHCD